MALVVICLFFGLGTGLVGKVKGSSFFIWFLIGCFLPGLGLLAAALYRFESDEPRTTCPNCGKRVRWSDQVCTRCGEDLFLLPPPEPEPAAARPTSASSSSSS